MFARKIARLKAKASSSWALRAVPKRSTPVAPKVVDSSVEQVPARTGGAVGGSWESSGAAHSYDEWAAPRIVQPPVATLASGGVLPPGVAIAPVDDPLEREADRVAGHVLAAAPQRSALAAPMPLAPSGRCSASRVLAEENGARGSVAGILRSPGSPLDAARRAEFEPIFGQDLGEVRIHSGPEAAAAARSVAASAFAFGSHIVLGHAQQASNRQLLAHELAHVVQQTGSRSASGTSPVRRPGGARSAIFRAPAPADRQLGPGPLLPADAQMVDLARIEYTQADVSFKTGAGVSLGRMAADMRKTGWDVSQPADVVKMDDGRLVSVDHRRLWAAEAAGITQVSVRVHPESDLLPTGTASRFRIGKGRVPQGTNPGTGKAWSAGDVPRTWGEAVRFRSAGQVFSKTGSASGSGFDPTALPGGGVRDPSFPASGSKDKPMRVQPGPLEARIDPTAGGSVIKSGGVRKNVPSGTLVKGEIEVKPVGSGPSGGGPGSAGGGGAGPLAETKPTMLEGRGSPVSEITAAAHAQNINATRGAMEGAWSLILAGQLSYVRGAELNKALRAFAALEPTIEQHRQKGIDVTVTVVAEVPDRPDVAAAATGVGDPGQVVLFRDMYISDLSLPRSSATSTTSTMYEAGSHSRDYVGLGDMTLNQQVRWQFGDKYPVPGTGPHSGFHFVEGKKVLPGYAPAKPVQTLSTQGLAGTWTPEMRQVFVGGLSQVMPLVGRTLSVALDPSGAAVPSMFLAGRPYAFENGGPTGTRIMTGRFKMGEGYPPQAQWFWSSFEYHPDKAVILLEWVRGQDMSGETLWDALFVWRRLSPGR